jgi:hypothetical protein
LYVQPRDRNSNKKIARENWGPYRYCLIIVYSIIWHMSSPMQVRLTLYTIM